MYISIYSMSHKGDRRERDREKEREKERKRARQRDRDAEWQRPKTCMILQVLCRVWRET